MASFSIDGEAVLGPQGRAQPVGGQRAGMGERSAKPEFAAMVLWASLVVAVGIYLLMVIPVMMRRWRIATGAAGILGLVYGGVLGLGAVTGASSPLEPLAGLGRTAPASDVVTMSVVGTQELTEAITQSRGKDRIVYFTADWCVSCAVIEREIWENPPALAGLGDALVIKIDVTDNTVDDQSLMRGLEVYGPPTILYVDGSATEIEGTRLIGEIDAEQFRAAARNAEML